MESGWPMAQGTSFELQRFVADCRAALADGDPAAALHAVVERAVAEPAAVLRALGEPQRAHVQKLHHASDLTVLNVIWAPGMTILPHDHRMCAVIGIYGGREDNIFWQRIDGSSDGKLRAVGARALGTRDCALLPREAIHSVTNPIARLSAAIHVYAGDFFATERSEWDAETLLERRYDVERALRSFEQAKSA